MGAPQTLPANFDGWDKNAAPATLPADFDKWDSPRPSAASRFGTNFLSGLGVTSDEQAKHFFTHPLDTFIKSIEAQGELATKARAAYDRGDYMEALQHGLNYLVPFIGQQTDQAGTQLKEGDYAGGIGRTLGAAAPILAGSPEARAAAANAASTAAEKSAAAVRATARGVNTGLEKAPGAIGGTVGATIGAKIAGPPGALVGATAGSIAGKEILPTLRIPGEGFGFPNRVTGGPESAPPFEPAPVVREIPKLPEAFQDRVPTLQGPPGTPGNPFRGPAAPEPAPAQPAGSAGSIAESVAAPNVENAPRTLSGESALREILTRQPNKTLMQIARSRGINVTQEAQLRPTNPVNNRIIGKIIDDFSDDELDNLRSTYLENEGRFGRHDFGDIGKEANQTLNLQTYFPDLKISLAQELRTQNAIAKAAADRTPKAAPLGDLAATLKEQSKAAPKPAAKAPAAQLNSGADDLTAILQESLRQAQQKSGQ